MAVDAPINMLVDKFIKNGFARRNHLGGVLAKGITSDSYSWSYDYIAVFQSGN